MVSSGSMAPVPERGILLVESRRWVKGKGQKHVVRGIGKCDNKADVQKGDRVTHVVKAI